MRKKTSLISKITSSIKASRSKYSVLYNLYNLRKSKNAFKKQITEIKSIIENNDKLVDDLLAANFYIENPKIMSFASMQYFKLNRHYMDNVHHTQVEENINFNINTLLNVKHHDTKFSTYMHIDRESDNVNYYKITLTPHMYLDVAAAKSSTRASIAPSIIVYTVILAAIAMSLMI